MEQNIKMIIENSIDEYLKLRFILSFSKIFTEGIIQ